MYLPPSLSVIGRPPVVVGALNTIDPVAFPWEDDTNTGVPGTPYDTEVELLEFADLNV
jgi:hypothetical protein